MILISAHQFILLAEFILQFKIIIIHWVFSFPNLIKFFLLELLDLKSIRYLYTSFNFTKINSIFMKNLMDVLYNL